MRIGVAVALLGGTALGALMTTSAFAQDKPGIETVVVTAEKRAENTVDVPVSLTSLNGDAIQQQGVIGVQQLQLQVPSLRFGVNPAGGQDVLTIRGFSSQNATGGGDSPVAYSVDGVYLARTTGVDPEFFDIDHIEVLRGPQGTLSGRNSVGGAVNVITNKPSDETGGHIDALVGDYNARIFRGWINIPIVSGNGTDVSFRLTGVAADHDGYQKNVSTAAGATHNADGEDYLMLRGQLLFNFGNDVDLLLEASTNQENAPPATKAQWINLPDQSRFAGQTWYTNPRVVAKNYPENYINKNDMAGATLNWRLGWATLTSVTGYAREHWSQTNDGDSSDLNLVYNPYWNETAEQYSEELRLASGDDQPLKWIAGFYYFHEQLAENFDIVDTGLNTGPVNASSFSSGGHINTSSYAPFAQIDYDFGKAGWIPLTLSGGIRYTNDDKTGQDFNDYCLTIFGLCFRTPAVGTESFSFSQGGISGDATAKYKLTDNQSLYASYSRGWLSGGKLLGTTPIYTPETVDSYEVGYKGNLFDNRLSLTLDAFYENIRNMQVFVASSTSSRIDNAGAAHDRGIELEFSALPVDNLTLNGSLSLQSAKYDNYFSIDTHFSPGVTTDFSGNTLNQTPNVTASLGAGYGIDTSIGTFTPRVDFFYSSRVYFLPDNFAAASQAPYTTTNLHLTWVDKSGHYQIEAFVNNLENKAVISNDAIEDTTEGNGVAPDDYTYLPPRIFGLRFGATY